MLIVDNKVMSVIELLDILEYEIKLELEKVVSWGGSNKDIYRLVKMLEVVDKGYYSDGLDDVIEELGHDVSRGKTWCNYWGEVCTWTVGEALTQLYQYLARELYHELGDYSLSHAQDLLRVCEIMESQPVLYNAEILDLMERWGQWDEVA